MSLMEVNNVEIDVLDIGEGEAVVLLHGLGSTKKDYDLQIPVLKDKFRLIVPDLRAHGNSTRVPKEQGVPYMAKDIYQILINKSIEKATFVGFSMGGAVSLEFAATYPEMVDKLVLINTGPDFNNTTDTGVDILAERTKIIKEQGFEFLTRNIAYNMFPEDHQKEWRDEFAERIAANDEDAYLKTFGELMKWGLGERLTRIKNKTLVIASDMDYTPVQYKKDYASRMQDARVVIIENSRHGVVLDQADKLNAELLKFLCDE